MPVLDRIYGPNALLLICTRSSTRRHDGRREVLTMQRNRPSRTCAPSGLQGHGAQRLVPNLAGRFHHPFELALLLVDIDAVSDDVAGEAALRADGELPGVAVAMILAVHKRWVFLHADSHSSLFHALGRHPFRQRRKKPIRIHACGIGTGRQLIGARHCVDRLLQFLWRDRAQPIRHDRGVRSRSRLLFWVTIRPSA